MYVLGSDNMRWQEVEEIEEEFFKLNPIVEKLKEISFKLSRKNADTPKLLTELNKTIRQLEDQQGVTFNKLDRQRNRP